MSITPLPFLTFFCRNRLQPSRISQCFCITTATRLRWVPRGNVNDNVSVSNWPTCYFNEWNQTHHRRELGWISKIIFISTWNLQLELFGGIPSLVEQARSRKNFVTRILQGWKKSKILGARVPFIRSAWLVIPSWVKLSWWHTHRKHN